MNSSLRKALPTLFRLPATLFLVAITIYQQTLSPDHGLLKHLYPYGFCRHEPTCSDFAKQQLKEKPFHIACFLIAKRVLSCHPWTRASDRKIKKIIQQAQGLH